jgi:hypothetical protein
MNIRPIPGLLTIVLLVMSSPMTSADEAGRPDHYRAVPSETLEDAVNNFVEYNRRLATLLAENTLDARHLDAVHQLTYTLEAALERISTELTALAEILEEVHVASETQDAETVRERGAEYLRVSGVLIE